MAETAIVSFYTLTVGFSLPTISKNSLYTLFWSLILDRGVLLIISISAPKILLNFLLDTSFHHSFQSLIIRSLTSSGESPGHTIPKRVLSFSDSRILNLYNPSKMSSGGIFVIDNIFSVPLRNEFLNIVVS